MNVFRDRFFHVEPPGGPFKDTVVRSSSLHMRRSRSLLVDSARLIESGLSNDVLMCDFSNVDHELIILFPVLWRIPIFV